MNRVWGLWAPLFLAVVLVFSAVWAGYREILPYVASGSDAQRKIAFLESRPDPGFSLEVQRLVLRDCVQVLRPLTAIELTDSEARVRENCQALAEEILSQSPMFSYAWYVLALSLSLESRGEAFQNALSRSQKTTANQWAMASLRLRLAYKYWSELRPDLREQLAADMVVLIHSSQGRKWLAQRYTDDVGFREYIVSSLEKAPAALQRNFIQTVSSLGAAK